MGVTSSSTWSGTVARCLVCSRVAAPKHPDVDAPIVTWRYNWQPKWARLRRLSTSFLPRVTGSEPQSPLRPRRIGIMGNGSFDPVHTGHVALAESALQHLDLDEVRWVPVGQAWQKPDLAPAADPIDMVEVGGGPSEPRFVVDPLRSIALGRLTRWIPFGPCRSGPVTSRMVSDHRLDQYRNLTCLAWMAELLRGAVRFAVVVATADALPDFDPGAGICPAHATHFCVLN